MQNVLEHWVILTNTSSNKKDFLLKLEKKTFPDKLSFLAKLNGIIFSKDTINKFIDKEERLDLKVINTTSLKALKNLSSGEQKISFLDYILHQKYDYLILDNVFDSLDTFHYEKFKEVITEISAETVIIQITSRKNDVLPFIDHNAELEEAKIIIQHTPTTNIETADPYFKGEIPKPITLNHQKFSKLIDFKSVSVSYLEEPILNKISWTVKHNEFWQLTGKNGSGKSTIISLITGDNPKAYGQNLILFDRLRGSGETVWEIKSKIGYFTPSMVYNFKGHHTVLHMLISGIQDSIGLYKKPSEVEVNKAMEWLKLLKIEHLKNSYFRNLNKGHQRLIMLARAFIKWPYLLILDEPTVDLDDQSVFLFSELLNKFHQESNTAIIYVSHRKEKGITPQKTIHLITSKNGSTAKIDSN